MEKTIRIGTRDSQLAQWQARLVQQLLAGQGIAAELVLIKSEGDLDLHTPLYAMGVQGVFTRSLDIALLESRIDMAVHSMKDVPTQVARGLQAAAVLKRASHQDLLLYRQTLEFLEDPDFPAVIATSSIRRRAQWLNRYPRHRIENLRGNVNSRLRKLAASDWQGAIFAAAGLERIDLRPEKSLALDWMLPAPAQGAILVVCRQGDPATYQAARQLNDPDTEICTGVERDFLKALMGGCSTPISALATRSGDRLLLEGNIVSPDGKQKAAVRLETGWDQLQGLGGRAARQLLDNGGAAIAAAISHGT